MFYIVQENTFREAHYNKLMESLDKMGLEYSVVRVFPFVDKIASIEDIPEDGSFNVEDLPDFKTDRKDVFVFGAIKLARISNLHGWNPGSLMNENHDYLVYREFYKENLLNYDSEIIKFNNYVQWEENESKFFRPCKDTKAIVGKVYDESGWNDFVKRSLESKFEGSSLNEETEIQVSTVKKIYKEIRFWVVDGKVITGSQYKLGKQVVYDPLYDDDARGFAQSMVDIFQLAKAFVIDVCLTENGWKIVECGCINCAGFYCADLQKVLTALEDLYSPEITFLV